MKRLNIFLLLVGLILIGITKSNAASSDYEAAAQAYRNGNFEESIKLYEAEIADAAAENKESPQLYYNLGNAYFRNKNLGKAIVNYERALLLDPSDSNIRHNLRYANSQTVDDIKSVGSSIFARGYKLVRNILTANDWARAAIVMFVFFLFSIVLYVFGKRLWVKKTSFIIGIILLLLTIFANTFAFSQKRELQCRDTAIIVNSAVGFNAAPDDNSNQLFELHEGSKVKILGSDGDWYESKIANGSVGWTRKSNLEVI